MAEKVGILWGDSVASGSLESQEDQGACVQQSSQASEQGNQLPLMSPEVGFQLRVAVYCEPWHAQAITLTGAQQAAESQGDPPFHPQGEWYRYTPRESAEFGDLNRGHMSEREMIAHRL